MMFMLTLTVTNRITAFVPVGTIVATICSLADPSYDGIRYPVLRINLADSLTSSFHMCWLMGVRCWMSMSQLVPYFRGKLLWSVS